jgi:indolepyruvate ferredoxin oxidoreductase beta subunit
MANDVVDASVLGIPQAVARPSNADPICLLVCALGGEGGGVLAEWLVETATHAGYAAQSTSIPGVAQRTGATSYYIEVCPLPERDLNGRRPVFSLNPVPGALDALVSSELLETVRQIQNGMSTAERTLVISSRERTLTTIEKMQLADGRVDSNELLELIRRYSRRTHLLDMSAVAQQSGTAISAVMFGAIAASGLLPFPRAAYEAVIRASGKAVDASLRGFAAAFDAVSAQRPKQPEPTAAAAKAAPGLPPAVAALPPALHEIAALGYARVREYQDDAYAGHYIRRLQRIVDAERCADALGAQNYRAAQETARYLALWMAFDDIVRVAELKSRASRFARVRREVKAADEEIVHLYDHFKPGVPEFAALLPAGFARRLQSWDKRRVARGQSPWALPLKIGTHTVFGLTALRLLAGMRWLRKRGARFALEQAMIEKWLDAIERGLRADWTLGFEIAGCGRLIKGYGTTNERGKENLIHVLEHLAATSSPAAERTAAIRAARAAALADDAGIALDKALTGRGAAPRPVKPQPILWTKNRATAHARARHL